MTIAVPPIAPKGGARCENCRRYRPQLDLFWHVGDGCFYCQDVQACEYRYYIQGEREASNTGRSTSER